MHRCLDIHWPGMACKDVNSYHLDRPMESWTGAAEDLGVVDDVVVDAVAVDGCGGGADDAAVAVVVAAGPKDTCLSCTP